MRTEKLLKEKGIEVDLIPVPRDISSDCGIAVELLKESEERALLILRENRISVTECYTKDSRGRFEKRKEVQIKV
jgi:uroporphyrinogen-III synthase